ncbi:MAG: sporulation protein YqfD, partial [Clostridia bacterium]|nr:sporulation protein YqfD [Clostridia bacterium]
MFLINLYRLLFGYVVLKIYGDFPQRLLNLCAKNHITTWNLHKRQDHIELSVMIKDFKRLRKVRAASGVKIRILKKCGIPFVLSRYKLRVGIVLGLTVFFATLKLLSCFVWEIEVVGAKNISQDEILGLCKKHGIYVGQYIKNIDTVISKDKILLDSDKLAWGAVNIEGSKITINITEVKSETPQFLPSNIVATEDAVIKTVKVHSGNLQIKIGEAVQKGDLLISGTVDVGDRVNFIKSSGDILGEIERKITIEKTYIQERKRYT